VSKAGVPAALPLLAGASFVLIGWSGLLIPSMVRSIERDFAVSDALLGAYYLVYAISYAAGSILGGVLTERVGRRLVLGVAGILLGAGLVTEGTQGAWVLFALGGMVQAFGSGAIDGGANGLFIDLYASSRGRPLLLLHTMFSVGALVAPAAVGAMLDAGVRWQAVLLATALAGGTAGILFLVSPIPSGRRRGVGGSGSGRVTIAMPLVLLGAAIGCYVASEVGVSNWLVRFLADAPLGVATGALSLFWAGLALGRLVSAKVAHAYDPVRFTAFAAVATALAVVAAVLVPSLPASIALFALVGFASGPIYPMIMTVAGDRYPGRAAAVSGLLGAAAVTGSILYPPVMGVISVTLGLTPAMLGTAVLALGCAVAVAAVGRHPPRAGVALPT
jgi:fucose permease